MLDTAVGAAAMVMVPLFFCVHFVGLAGRKGGQEQETSSVMRS